MSKVLAAGDPGSLDEAADVLASGGVVVIPTDTVYGIAARAGDAVAVGRIFEAKARPRSKPVAVLIDGLHSARSLADLDAEAEAAADAGWPGPLTLVLPRRPGVSWDLGGDPGSIGLRVPDHDLPLELIRRCGPLAATSANPTGEDVAATIEEIRGDLGDRVDLYMDAGPIRGRPSKVVSLHGEARTLRE